MHTRPPHTYTHTHTAREPVFTEHPSSVTVDQGSVFSLSCSVRGFPPPTVQWYKDGSVFLVIAPQGTSLVFPPASDEYEGVYQCRALQESSQPVFSNTAIVTVRCKCILCMYSI